MADRRSRRLRNVIGGSAGNLVEWYDWYAYTALSLYFASVFFPNKTPTLELLSTAIVFAVGFLMRPLGAWWMGIYGDRHGRKAGMALSVALMAGGSLIIAIAPTYAQAGILAPAVLLIARMMQGLSVGGEYGTSATYLSEVASRKRRGFWSSFQYFTLIGGQLLSLAVLLLLQAFLTDAQLTAWGWRIPFVIGSILAIGVYLLRRRIEETESFRRMPADRQLSSAKNLWRGHAREFVIVAIISAGGSLSFYTYTTYMQKFMVNTSGFSKETATQLMTFALIAFMLMQPLWGMVSDRLGRKPLLFLFSIGGMIATVPVMSSLAMVKSPLAAFVLILVPLTLLGAYTSIGAVFKAELFPAHIRTLGVALPYAVGNALFGGTAEAVALLFKNNGMESGFYWYVTFMLGCATVAFAMLPETQKTSLIEED